MPVKILYVDLRNRKQTMEAFTVAWNGELTASEAIRRALRQDIADQVIRDLNDDNPEIMIAWHDLKTGEHSGVGGVGSLDWQIPDRSVLIVSYQDEDTTQQQFDLSSDWMIENMDIE